MVAASAVATAAPTYRAMLDTPEAPPTWFSGTAAVDADDAGPLDMPIPTAMATSGSRNAEYCQDAWTRPTMTNPRVVRAKPRPIVCRPPNFAASRGTMGATTTRPTVAGSVARPAWSGLNPSVAGF